jgi:hypothetical protein
MKIARKLSFGVTGVLFLTLAFAAQAAQPPLCSKLHPPDTTNAPFELTNCWTTIYGPAQADVIVVPPNAAVKAATSSPNMLSCQGGAYALCFFSGPPAGIAGGQPLPCVLRPDGKTADCTCQYYGSGTYYVDMNGILSLGAYYQTVSQCGPEGGGCLNIVNCPPGTQCPGSPSQAQVCTSINNQSLGSSPPSFYPQIQAISTFSFAMSPPKGNYALAKDPPACKGQYAGCMTAACRFADGSAPSSHQDGDPIQCECPVYNGDYQVGAQGQSCTIPSQNGKNYVWSASNTVLPKAPTSKK